MSYILEALKKSQQERELGHVPTLESPAFPAEERGERPNPWVLVAVILAALAVVIALFTALRGGPQAPDAVEAVARKAPPEALRARSEPAAPEQRSSAPVADGQEVVQPGSKQQAPRLPSVQDPASREEEDSDLVMEAPAVAPPRPTQERMPPVAQAPPPAPARPQEGKVPEDLIADIEAFKREVRAAQTRKGKSKKNEEKKTKKIAPEDLRLPKDLRERLPEFIMSAHIYDKVPSKRFVLINGLKTREGEESREEITVVEILPDGAVLSFEGNRFYQRR